MSGRGYRGRGGRGHSSSNRGSGRGGNSNSNNGGGKKPSTPVKKTLLDHVYTIRTGKQAGEFITNTKFIINHITATITTTLKKRKEFDFSSARPSHIGNGSGEESYRGSREQDAIRGGDQSVCGTAGSVSFQQRQCVCVDLETMQQGIAGKASNTHDRRLMVIQSSS